MFKGRKFSFIPLNIDQLVFHHYLTGEFRHFQTAGAPLPCASRFFREQIFLLAGDNFIGIEIP